MKNRLVRYIVLAYAFTWLFWWADAILLYVTGQTVEDTVPRILLALGALGPAAAALCSLDCGFTMIKVKALLLGIRHKRVIHAPEYAAGVREKRPKKGWLWFFAVLAGETALCVLCAEGITRHDPLAAADFARWLILYTFLAGSQELGWRGTLQPLLQKKLPYPMTVLTVGLVWGVWHLPLCFMTGLFNGLSGFGPAQSLLIFLLASLTLSFWLGAVYNKTNAVIWPMLLYGWTGALTDLVKLRLNGRTLAAAALFTLICLVIGMTGAGNEAVKIKRE